jgi:hypothetical protein
VVVASVIESFLHFIETGEVRYVAYFADPVKYLKENTNFGGNFAAHAQGISYTTLEKFNNENFILNKKTHSGKDIRVKFSVYTS